MAGKNQLPNPPGTMKIMQIVPRSEAVRIKREREMLRREKKKRLLSSRR